MDTEPDGRTVIRLGIERLQDVDGEERYATGHISTPVLHTYGGFEAKVKFDNIAGGHSAFWLNSDYEASATTGHHEFDIAEHFDDDFIQHRVYQNVDIDPDKDDRVAYPATSDPDYPMKTLPDSTTWWDEYHIVRGRWLPNGYKIQVEGRGWVDVPTNGWSGTERKSLILSLLINDRNIEKLGAAFDAPGGQMINQGISIDWVKTWQ